MRTMFLLLELLGGIFGWIWIGGSIAVVYFLYGALADDGPWLYVLWSAVVGFVAKTIAVVLNENQRRLDYVDQLNQRGYPKYEAEAAWRTAADGGFNVLLSLQQAESSHQLDQSEAASDSGNTDNSGAANE